MDDGRLNALLARADAARSEYIEATQPNKYGKPQGDWLPASSTYGQLANNVLELVAEVWRLQEHGRLAHAEAERWETVALEFGGAKASVRYGQLATPDERDVRSRLNDGDPED